jgi:hypothetical protein
VSDEEQDGVNHLGEMLLIEELEEAKTSLEAFMQEFAGNEQKSQDSRNHGPDVPILFLIVRRLCHRICKKDLFCPYPKCKAGIKNVSFLLTHLNKKHELADVCCKDLVRHFVHGIYPDRIDIVLKTGDGTTVDGLWGVQRCP